jgi:hypothetical protein
MQYKIDAVQIENEIQTPIDPDLGLHSGHCVHAQELIAHRDIICQSARARAVSLRALFRKTIRCKGRLGRVVHLVRPSYHSSMRCSGALLATALGTAAGQHLSCKYKGADFSALNKAGVSRLLMSTLRALRALRALQAQRLGSSQTQATLRAVAPRTDRAPDRGAAGITAHQPVRPGRCVQRGPHAEQLQLLPHDQLLNLNLDLR